MELQRGQRLGLEQLIAPEHPFVFAIKVHIPQTEVDCACFGLDAQSLVTDDRYMTFFNQPCTPCGGISLAAPHDAVEGFEFNLQVIPPKIARIALVATLDGEGTFSQVTEGEVRLLQDGKIVARFCFYGELFTNEKSLILIELYRKDAAWRLTAAGQGFNGGFEALVRHFGVDVSNEDTSAQQTPVPPLSLLQSEDLPPLTAKDPGQCEATARAIEQILGGFKVKGSIVDIEQGPIVTTYALKPAPGVRVVRVLNLEPDLALALSTSGLRIDPLFVHGVIGIEIPNPERAIVPVRRILADDTYQKSNKLSLLPLGVDTRGKPVVADLEVLPHLLVAGTTRSGKSVALHGMICGLLLRASVRETRLLLLDPKRNEFSLYDGTPHLLAPVLTEARHAVIALDWLTREMDSRYQQMNTLEVRNLEGWRLKLIEQSRLLGRLPGNEEPISEPPPLLIVVVDELADLMLQSNKAIEQPLVRLAQMGRAAGIHLILATQRPSRDVLTGLIKSNIPARLAFKVTSGTDSRIILDNTGAENLLGRGDGLFITPGHALQRIQAPWVTEANVTAITHFLKRTTSVAPIPSLMSSLELDC